jgi:hypothetical protein
MSKGNKPKRQLSTATNHLLDQLKRRSGVRNLAKRFLIVCEDNKSAPNYFKALKKQFGLSATSVEVAGSGGSTQPIQVVDRALEIRRNSESAESGTEPFSEVWCILDGDYGKKIAVARTKAKTEDIKLAISTMCFEYWLLLHFEENDKSTVDCSGLVRLLKKSHVHDYSKGKCDFLAIVPLVHDACNRASKLRQHGLRRGTLPENQNPCSEVYLLIEEILKN